MSISLSAHQFDFATNELGTIHVHMLAIGGWGKLGRYVRDLSAAESREFARRLLTAVGERDAADVAEERDLHLTDTEARLVSDAELERFAGMFIEHNEWLFKDPSPKAAAVVDERTGETKRIAKHDKLDIPRAAGETNVVYLKRLLVNHASLVHEQMEQMTSRLSGVFLEPTRQLFGENLRLSQQLSESLKRLATATEGSAPVSRSTAATSEVQRDITASVRSPGELIDEVSNHLDRLEGHVSGMRIVAADGAALLRSMNDLGREMAADYAAASSRSARHGIALIAIALFSMIVTAAASIWSGCQQREYLGLLRNAGNHGAAPEETSVGQTAAAEAPAIVSSPDLGLQVQPVDYQLLEDAADSAQSDSTNARQTAATEARVIASSPDPQVQPVDGQLLEGAADSAQSDSANARLSDRGHG